MKAALLLLTALLAPAAMAQPTAVPEATKLPELAAGADLAAFPIKDPYYATITSALLKNDERDREVRYRTLTLKGLPTREEIPYFGSTQNRLELRYWPAPQPGPLVVMIAGLGSSAAASYYNYLGYLFAKRGVHSLVVPSPFHRSFALAASSTGYPGVTAEDAADLYRVIQAAVAKLERAGQFRPTSIGLLGVSMGALEAAFVAELDARERKLNFTRTLLINPPVDPLFSIRALDQLTAAAKGVPADRAEKLKLAAVDFGLSRLVGGDVSSPDYFAAIEKGLPISVPERKALIVSSLRGFLAPLLFTTQQIEDLGALPGPVATADLKERFDEAERFGFSDYVEKFLLPFRTKHAGRPVRYEELLPLTALSGVEAFLRADPRVLVFHNADDFLVNEAQVAYLREVFGPRLTLYPHGGHVGNLWFPANRDAILEAFGAQP